MVESVDTDRIDFLTEQLAILRRVEQWPEKDDEVAEKEAELRQCLIEVEA